MSKSLPPSASTGLESSGITASLLESACVMRLHAATDTEIRRARLKYLRLGCVNVIHYTAIGVHTAERTRAHILQDNARYFFLCLPMGARQRVQYRGHLEDASLQSFLLLSSDTPFVTEQCSMTRGAEFEEMVVRLPAGATRQLIPRIDDLCGHFLPMTSGMANAMRCAANWARDAGFLDEPSGTSIGAGIFEMVCTYAEQATLSREIEEYRKSSLERTLERATAYIEQNLSNPGLTAAEVAKHCGISARYLQTVFAYQSESVSHFIRERRLQLCRRSLLDPALAHRSVIEIASDWGFSDPSHFSRIYKVRFGVAPGFDRRLALSPAGR